MKSRHLIERYIAAMLMLAAFCRIQADTIPVSSFSSAYGTSASSTTRLSSSIGEAIIGTASNGTTSVSSGMLALPWFYASLTNAAPEFTSATLDTATEDLAFIYVAKAIDPDGDVVSFTFADIPSWASTSNDSLFGTPQEGNGDTTFTVSASDGKLPNSRTVAIKVLAVNDKPVVTSADSAVAIEQQAFRYVASAFDPDNTPSISFADLPAWIAQQGSSDTLTGTVPLNVQPASFQVIASDGSLQDTITVTIKVISTNVEPLITSALVDTATEGILFTYTATGYDPNGARPTITISSAPTWMTVTNDTVVSGVPPEGTRSASFVITASDGSLDVSANVSINVVPVNNPPEITSSDTATAIEDSLFVYQALVIDPDNAPDVWFENYPGWLSTSGDSLLGRAPDTAQTPTGFRVIATDGEFFDTLAVSVTIIPVNDKPAITSSRLIKVLINETATYTATAIDADDDPLIISFTGLPAWAVKSGDTLTLTAPPDPTTDTFTVFAADAALADSIEVVIQVALQNRAPTITSASTAATTEDASFTYTATATDLDNDSLQFTFSNAPAWLSAQQASIAGVAPGTHTIDSFTVKVFDGRDSASQQVVVAISLVNDTPHIVSRPDTIAWAGTSYSYKVRASDEENHTITFHLDQSPAGMTIDSTDGRISWNPTNAQKGVHTVIVQASDEQGAAVKQQFTVTVNVDGVPRSTIGSISDTRNDITVPYTLSDADGDLLRIEVFYWTNGGWIKTTSLTGDTATIDSSKYVSALTWHSAADLPNTQRSVKVRILPYDTAAGVAGESDEFWLDNTPALTFANHSPASLTGIHSAKTISIEYSGAFINSAALTTDKITVSGPKSGKLNASSIEVAGDAVVAHLSALPVAGDTLTVRLHSSIQDNYGKGYDGNGNGIPGETTIDDYVWSFPVAWPGDYNLDGMVDFGDLSYVSSLWYQSAGGVTSPDSILELAPASGTRPHLQVTGDSLFDFEDLSVFLGMWHYSAASPTAKMLARGPLASRIQALDLTTASSPAITPLPGLAKRTNDWTTELTFAVPQYQAITIEEASDYWNNNLLLSLDARNVRGLVACRYRLTFNPDHYTISNQDNCAFLRQNKGNVLSFSDRTARSLELNMTRLSATSLSASGSGTIAAIRVTPKSHERSPIRVDYELIDEQHVVIEAGYYELYRRNNTPHISKPRAPACYNFVSAPNPATPAGSHEHIDLHNASHLTSEIKSNDAGMLLAFDIETGGNCKALNVQIIIQDMNGIMVTRTARRNLVNETGSSVYNVKKYAVYWDGYSMQGRPVQPGVYRATLIWDAEHRSGKESIAIGIK
ncbi:MAG: hypothetical protein GF398_20235 [Chitinivibrionales bacterium]|nr:hypothetical protein [Chitinivibrionales bacterium]